MMLRRVAPLVSLGSVLMLGIVSCGSDNADTPVPTATPTETPVPPTYTPTGTPVPPTATPTDTPVPTGTPTNTPTYTPVPTETPKTAFEREEQMTQDEFKSAVLGKDAQGVIAAVGKPHEITSSDPYIYWEYYLLTTNPITGDVDEMAQVGFLNGIVLDVKFD